MRRTFFYLRSSFPLLLPDDLTRPTIKQHPTRSNIKQHPAHPTTPHHVNGEQGAPPHALTLTTSTDRHAIDRFRASDGRTLAPSGMPHALHRAPSVPSRTPSPFMVCVRIYLQVSPYLHHTNGLQRGGCPFLVEVCSKYQFALTVKNLTRFQGFDLRMAVFGNFGF